LRAARQKNYGNSKSTPAPLSPSRTAGLVQIKN
jgi:hypothetical protein